jgi:hypothetical protein
MKKAIHKQDQTFKQQQQQLPDANRNTKVKLLGIWIEREREAEPGKGFEEPEFRTQAPWARQPSLCALCVCLN